VSFFSRLIASWVHPSTTYNLLFHRSNKNSIAVQLQDSKLSMEAQIREELESEYMLKQQEIIASYGDRKISDLESKLREELTQVKGERERWKSEQEDLMKKVRDSQQQFECVREGFKSTSYSLPDFFASCHFARISTYPLISPCY
jgi:hypothetical protein